MTKATRKRSRGKNNIKKRQDRIKSRLGRKPRVPRSNSRRGRPPGTLSPKTRLLAEAILGILAKTNSPMSTRQVYYQCVSTNVVQATKNGYLRVQNLLVYLRRNGTIPPYRIVDRSRPVHQVSQWNSIGESFDSLRQFYRRDLFQTQPVVPIIGMEKDALSGVISDVVDEYGVPLFVCRGYPSLALLQDWEDEIRTLNADGKEVRIFYFGDFDPTGVDIPRFIEESLTESGVAFRFTIRGLLKSDMVEYKLHSVTLKKKDTRTKDFVRIHGTQAAELDALPADVLRQRVRDSIDSCIDKEAWGKLKKIEQHDRVELDKRLKAMRWLKKRREPA